jgi:hypothetical protein
MAIEKDLLWTVNWLHFTEPKIKKQIAEKANGDPPGHRQKQKSSAL